MNSFLWFNVLIVLICAVQRMSEGKVSRRLQYALWLTLPAYSFFATLTELKSLAEVMEYVSPSLSAPIARLEIAVTTDLSAVIALMVELLSARGISVGAQFLTIVRILRYGVTVLLVLALLTYNICFFIRCLRRRRYYKRDEKTGMRIYLLDYPQTPFLLGRGIYVHPDMTQNPASLEHAICHEACHYRQGDALWVPLRILLTAFYWFDPLVWLAADLIQRDSELSCDEYAIATLGEDQRKAYGETLIALLRDNRGRIALDFATTMKSTKRLLQDRIVTIARRPQRSKPVTLLVALFLSFTMLYLVTGAGIAVFATGEETADAVFVWDGTGAERDSIRRVTLYRINGETSYPGVDITEAVLSGQAAYLHEPGHYFVKALTNQGIVDLSGGSTDQSAYEKGLLPKNTINLNDGQE